MERVTVDNIVQNPDVLVAPAVTDPIHAYSFPLRGSKWMDCQYRQIDGVHRWVFANGGTMTPAQWPAQIARGLARTGRFGGHCPYTVGLHSVYLAEYVRIKYGDPIITILAATHDAPECLGVGDMNTHLKRQIGQAIRSYEDDLWLDFLLQKQFRLGDLVTEDRLKIVHEADKLFGSIEARLLDMQNANPWRSGTDNDVYRFLNARTLADESPYRTADLLLSEFYNAWYEAGLPDLRGPYF